MRLDARNAYCASSLQSSPSWPGAVRAAGSSGRPTSPAGQFSLRHTGAYRIEAGDRAPGFASSTRTRSPRTRACARTARITVPLVGDVPAAGLTPAELSRSLEERLRPFIVAVSVSVLVEEGQPTRVSVVGEVTHAGSYVTSTDAGVLEAIALAGGPTEFACRSCIFVLRRVGDQTVRMRFTYERLVHGEMPDARFTLRPGDSVVVE